MKQSLRILHLEDSVEDSELIRQFLLKDNLNCVFHRVETRADFFEALQKEPVDLILADLKLPAFSGMDALEISRGLRSEIPFIFVSGTIGEETAINSLRNGATDYVLKGHFNRLGPAVRRALAEAEERTLRRQLEQRLHEVARLEAVGTLSSGIAHDFNNALTIILGHASLLNTEYQRPERVLEITRTITAAAKRASEIVQQLLAFAHKSNAQAVPVDINRCLRDAVESLRKTVPEKIGLQFDLAPGLPSIPVDIGQFDRVLRNLVTNAIESMPAGGGITFSTRLVEGREIPDLIPDLTGGQYVQVRVADTGLGIDATTREHIFEPFFTTKERGRGTGLGLPVVYGIMQAHHGWVQIESEPDRGTSILLYFPLEQRKTSPAPDGSSSLGGTETILVVEDEEDVRFFLETVLRSHGFPVLSASYSGQALELFQANQEAVQLVFSDFGLPGTDGITLCAELRARKPSVKIILASGYSPKEFKERLGDLAVDAFLPKPYTSQGVVDSVRNALDGVKSPAPI
jgi:signal transduction histidine kinase